MTVHDLDTPALLIDLDIMEANLARAADYAREHHLRLRPHTKTHKIPALARQQLALGAAGLSVAKTTEGEVMLASGTPDLLVAYPVVGGPKVARLLQLARHAEATVALDSLEAAKPIAEAAASAGLEIGVLAEVDVGLGRVGVPPGPALIELIRGIQMLRGLCWRGVAFYPGHIKSVAGNEEALAALRTTLSLMLDDLQRAGLEPEIVSGGSTPLLYESHSLPGLNEIRPGTYIFNDRNCLYGGYCRAEDCAATILATVVSVQQNRMILDCGSKTLSSDKLSTGEDAYFGEVLGAEGAHLHKLNEEHGYVDLSACERRFHVGERVQVLMNHVCVSVNLQEQIYGVRGGLVEHVWRVEGRGKLQ
jgi:D-serine deaminase-like pyridoxal phosphate-dependent protein